MERLGFTLIESIILVILIILGLLSFFYIIWYRYKILKLGKSENRTDQIRKRILKTIKFALGQSRMPEEKVHGILHMFIFYGFLVVSIRTLTLFISGVIGNPEFHLPLLGHNQILGKIYALLKDIFEILVIIGVVGAAYRRVVIRERRFGKKMFEPLMILFAIFLLMITDLIIDGSYYIAGGKASVIFTPFGHLSKLIISLLGFAPGNGLSTLYHISLWIHLITILLFLNYLPMGKHFHIITAIPNVFLSNLEPSGKIHKIENLEEIDENTILGAQSIQDLTWKEYLDLYTCTECGRCIVDCPTDVTEKPLSQKDLNLQLKKHLYQVAPKLVIEKEPDDLFKKIFIKVNEIKSKIFKGKSEATGQTDNENKELFLAGDIISRDTIWACTNCGYCEHRCPVFIENVPRIIEMRRHLVLMQGDFPQELNATFRGLERNNNPWNIGYMKRGEWAKELGVPLLSENQNVEYLFFVGCMGSFDSKYINATKALAKILKEAGVSFAILGPEENCCGDPARRLGNEYLAQMQIEANLETMNNYKVKKIITNCPHCYHILAFEYPDFGAKFEVYHATEILEILIKENKLKPNIPIPSTISLHDSCFLARHHRIYKEPREIINNIPGLVFKEPKNNKYWTFCCGAGGGRMWLEEKEPRINHKRFQEFKSLNVDIIATVCPFCFTMLSDAVADNKLSDSISVMDLMQLIEKSLKKEENS